MVRFYLVSVSAICGLICGIAVNSVSAYGIDPTLNGLAQELSEQAKAVVECIEKIEALNKRASGAAQRDQLHTQRLDDLENRVQGLQEQVELLITHKADRAVLPVKLIERVR